MQFEEKSKIQRSSALCIVHIKIAKKKADMIWMLCVSSLNNKTNVQHERNLEIAYNDCTSSFET